MCSNSEIAKANPTTYNSAILYGLQEPLYSELGICIWPQAWNEGRAEDAAAAIFKPQRPFVLHRTSRASLPILKYLGWFSLTETFKAFMRRAWRGRVALEIWGILQYLWEYYYHRWKMCILCPLFFRSFVALSKCTRDEVLGKQDTMKMQL